MRVLIKMNCYCPEPLYIAEATVDAFHKKKRGLHVTVHQAHVLLRASGRKDLWGGIFEETPQDHACIVNHTHAIVVPSNICCVRRCSRNAQFFHQRAVVEIHKCALSCSLQCCNCHGMAQVHCHIAHAKAHTSPLEIDWQGKCALFSNSPAFTTRVTAQRTLSIHSLCCLIFQEYIHCLVISMYERRKAVMRSWRQFPRNPRCHAFQACGQLRYARALEELWGQRGEGRNVLLPVTAHAMHLLSASLLQCPVPPDTV
mmetsp:Transcript_99576/g.277213  ORF Transcript_99576/g.277213 Transcript_99576/m.277213 type:complete len:257 (-) Transcript_99576:766-1536(-)